MPMLLSQLYLYFSFLVAAAPKALRFSSLRRHLRPPSPAGDFVSEPILLSAGAIESLP